MSTLNLNGFAAVFSDDVEQIENFRPNIQISVFVGENFSDASFSYSIDPNNQDESFPDIFLNVPSNRITFRDIDANESFNTNAFVLSLGQLQWVDEAGAQQSTTILNAFYEDISFFSSLEDFDYIIELGGDPLPEFSSQQDFQTFIDESFLEINSSVPLEFAPDQEIPVNIIPDIFFTEDDNVVLSNNSGSQVSTGQGNDTITGSFGDDIINPGGNEGGFDFIFGSQGNDTIIYSDSLLDDYQGLQYRFAGFSEGITANINGVANTATIDKGSNGIDTIIDVQNPLFGGGQSSTGGLSVRGTDNDDVYNITNIDTPTTFDTPDAQWISLVGYGGQDTYNINSGLVRIDLRDGFEGVDVNLSQGTVFNDGFGFQEEINTSGNGAVWEISAGRNSNDDTLIGSSNDESFIGFGGNDFIDGSDGFDRLRFDRNGHDSVFVDLEIGSASGSFNGEAFNYQINSIEWVRGSFGNDFLIGNEEDNRLQGSGGSDTLVGGAGDDFLQGGDGFDTASYEDFSGFQTQGIVADLQTRIVTDNFGDTDTLSTSIEQIIGSSLDDIINGSNGSDQIGGGDGNDIINPGDNRGGTFGREGFEEFDFLIGSSGNDTYDFSDIVDGYVGLQYRFSGLSEGVIFDLDSALNTATVDKGSAGIDTITDVINPISADRGGLSLRGTDFDDVYNIAISNNNDFIRDGDSGFVFDNNITPNSEFIALRGNGGQDTYNIISGTFVRVDLRGGFEGINVDLSQGIIFNDGFGFQETITGDVWELRGGGNSDILIGSDNNESFIGEQGNDIIDGGDGFDRLRYDRTGAEQVTVDLQNGTTFGTWNGQAFNDTISNIEWVRGTLLGDDILIGDNADNLIEGEGGNDTISDGGGNDNLFGGAGDDVFIAGTGQNDYDGGSGSDTVDFSAFSGAINVNLATGVTSGGAAGNDTLVDIENIVGTNGNDRLVGSSAANILSGGNGDDTILDAGGNDDVFGGAGDDVFIAGTGQNDYDGGSGSDTVDFSAFSGAINVNLATGSTSGGASGNAAGNDTLVNIENIVGTRGNDTLTGNGLANTFSDGGGNDDIFGGAGDDVFIAGVGQNDYDGGSGSDTVDFSAFSGAINVNLATGATSGGAAGNDTIVDIENVVGTNGNDRLVGSSADNILSGGNGNDRLFGASGSDVLNGSEGNDFLDGGGGSGIDQLFGGEDADVFHFDRGEGVDIVNDFQNNIDTIEFDNFTNTTTTAAFISDFATVNGNDVIFDFGSDGSLTVLNTTLGQLQNDIEIV